MKKNKSWRQPIPVTIPELKNDPFGELLFQRLVLKARDEPGYVEVEGVPIWLERGEVIFGRETWAVAFGASRNLNEQSAQAQRVYRRLIKLEKVNNLINKRKSLNCSIVTIKNYDEVIQMNKPMNNRQTIDEQSMNTNKSAKSVKSGKKAQLAKNIPQVLGLTYPEVYQIADQTNVYIDNVRDVLRSLVKEFEGKGEKVKSPKSLLVAAIRSRLGSGELHTMNDSERLIFPQESPESIAKQQKRLDQLKEAGVI